MVDNVSTDFPSRIQKELALPKPVKSLKRATKRKNTERAVGPILKSTKRATVLPGDNIGMNMIS